MKYEKKDDKKQAKSKAIDHAKKMGLKSKYVRSKGGNMTMLAKK